MLSLKAANDHRKKNSIARKKWAKKNRIEARNFFVFDFPYKINIAIYLPGSICADLKHDLESGLVKKTDYFILVERTKTCWKKIDKFVEENGLNVYFHKGELHHLDLASILKNRKIDYFPLDICGNCTAEIVYWLYKNQDYFRKDMRMSVTFAIHPRGEKVRKNTNEAKFPYVLNKFTRKTMKELGLDRIYGNILGADDFVKTKNLSRDINVIFKSLYYAFSHRELKFENYTIYRAFKTNMIKIDFIVQNKKQEDKTFLTIVQEYSKKVCWQKQLIKQGPSPYQLMKKVKIHIKNAHDIARHLGIYGQYKSLDEMKGQKRAHITIMANKHGINAEQAIKFIKNRLNKYGIEAA